MRTTVNLDPDVEKAVVALRRERGIGLSDAVNELVRVGMTSARADFVYHHPSHDMGMRIDVANIGVVLDLLDQEG